ncbi:dual specificity phosphatase [Pandoravirus inopinatum]|uniref:Dual specificity phosphatase n=1 Tax=Pandoravirus inopinatum TaxID=1605721 RepID=A0A0B5JDI6_9VIRU|nr:dual specificity phosphatase [Pandoravirus inopinatum]AJF97777.1 dual specificity phosphatase [Pandoravirus inopinatum]
MADTDDCPFADRISAGLHLGDLRAMTALAQAEAEEQAEWCVVTVLSERDLAGLALPRHVDHHLIIRADDDLAVDLTPEFVRAHAVIASALARDKSCSCTLWRHLALGHHCRGLPHPRSRYRRRGGPCRPAPASPLHRPQRRLSPATQGPRRGQRRAPLPRQRPTDGPNTQLVIPQTHLFFVFSFFGRCRCVD